MIKSKLEEFKNIFINETKEVLINNIKEEWKTIFAEELAKFKEVNKKMDEISSTKKMLQQHVSTLKRSNEELIKRCEENEQYGRRLCLRIKGIPRKVKEKSDEVLDQVRSLFDVAEVNIPAAVLDRAHHVSKKTNGIIRKRKSLKGKSVHLDLMKSRLQLHSNAKKVITNKDNISFCYADINCR